MITGDQLRAIMNGLGWSPARLADRLGLRLATVESALASRGVAGFASDEEQRLRALLGQDGVMILEPKGHDLGVRILTGSTALR